MSCNYKHTRAPNSGFHFSYSERLEENYAGMAFLPLLLDNDGLCTTDDVPAHLLGHTDEGKSPWMLGRGWRGVWKESGKPGIGLLLSSRFTCGRVKGKTPVLVPWFCAPQPVYFYLLGSPVQSGEPQPCPSCYDLQALVWIPPHSDLGQASASRPYKQLLASSSLAHPLGSWT